MLAELRGRAIAARPIFDFRGGTMTASYRGGATLRSPAPGQLGECPRQPRAPAARTGLHRGRGRQPFPFGGVNAR
jgi:hypothetical protein